MEQFSRVLKSENHTLKRALTDPTLFSGIGNAYSDEILHRAKLSPMALTSRLPDDDIARLFDATKATLVDFTNRMRAEIGDGFPEKVAGSGDGGAGTTSWTDANNWSANVVPNNGTPAGTTNAVTINPGVAVNLTASAIIDTLTIGAGDSLTVNAGTSLQIAGSTITNA